MNDMTELKFLDMLFVVSGKSALFEKTVKISRLTYINKEIYYQEANQICHGSNGKKSRKKIRSALSR